jgi:hypothetical protein
MAITTVKVTKRFYNKIICDFDETAMPNLAKISKISVDHHLQNHSGYIISFYICNIVGPGCVFYEWNHSLNSSVLAELEVTFTISLFITDMLSTNDSDKACQKTINMLKTLEKQLT